jgi:hypothetical protein
MIDARGQIDARGHLATVMLSQVTLHSFFPFTWTTTTTASPSKLSHLVQLGLFPTARNSGLSRILLELGLNPIFNNSDNFNLGMGLSLGNGIIDLICLTSGKPAHRTKNLPNDLHLAHTDSPMNCLL